MTANSGTPLNGRGSDRSGTKLEDDLFQRKGKHSKIDRNSTTEKHIAWIPRKKDEDTSPKHSTLREDALRSSESCNDGESCNAMSGKG